MEYDDDRWKDEDGDDPYSRKYKAIMRATLRAEDDIPATWLEDRPLYLQLVWLIVPPLEVALVMLATWMTSGLINEDLFTLFVLSVVVGVCGAVPKSMRKYGRYMQRGKDERVTESVLRSFAVAIPLCAFLALVLLALQDESPAVRLLVFAFAVINLAAVFAWYFHDERLSMTAKGRQAYEEAHFLAPGFRRGVRAITDKVREAWWIFKAVRARLFWGLVILALVVFLLWKLAMAIGPLWMIPIAIVAGALVIARALRRA